MFNNGAICSRNQGSSTIRLYLHLNSAVFRIVFFLELAAIISVLTSNLDATKDQKHFQINRVDLKHRVLIKQQEMLKSKSIFMQGQTNKDTCK